MLDQKTTTIPSFIQSSAREHALVRDVLIVIAASLLIAVAAQVSVPIPFSPVPMTLQPMAVLLVGAVLGSVRGGAAAALYLLEGATGLPVFAGGKGGLVWLIAGPTAGYLLSYPFVAWVTGWLSERGWSRSPLSTIPMMMIGIAMIHLGGWSWLAAMMGLGMSEAFVLGTAPFLMGDLVKIAIAAALLPSIQSIVGRLER
ncbi:MAG: biotin transporter BioY [Thermoanaerobaculia bacterium]|nr:biotin transporter BioY [Thermoanaerobaculia bacterium]